MTFDDLGRGARGINAAGASRSREKSAGREMPLSRGNVKDNRAFPTADRCYDARKRRKMAIFEEARMSDVLLETVEDGVLTLTLVSWTRSHRV